MTTISLAASDAMMPGESVVRVSRCDLKVAPLIWSYQLSNTADIDRHWHRQRAQNPQMFNGVVHLLSIRHHRELSVQFARLWPGTAAL